MCFPYKIMCVRHLNVYFFEGFPQGRPPFSPCGEAEGSPGQHPALIPSRSPQPPLLARTLLAACTANILGIELDPCTTRDSGIWAAVFPHRVGEKCRERCRESMAVKLPWGGINVCRAGSGELGLFIPFPCHGVWEYVTFCCHRT